MEEYKIVTDFNTTIAVLLNIKSHVVYRPCYNRKRNSQGVLEFWRFYNRVSNSDINFCVL